MLASKMGTSRYLVLLQQEYTCVFVGEMPNRGYTLSGARGPESHLEIAKRGDQ